MTDPWNFAGPVTLLGPDRGGHPGRRVDLRHQRQRRRHRPGGGPGPLRPGHPDPLPLRGAGQRARAPSRWPRSTDDPFTATFVSRCLPAPGRADSTLMVFRSRYVGQGMREDLDHPQLRRRGRRLHRRDVRRRRLRRPVRGQGGAGRRRTAHRRADHGRWTVRRDPGLGPSAGGHRGLHLPAGRGDPRASRSGPRVVDGWRPDLATYEVVVPARGRVVDLPRGRPGHRRRRRRSPKYRCGEPVERATPTERLAEWRRQVPQVETDHPGLKEVIARSAEDLGALRIFDPDYPERVVVAAGRPVVHDRLRPRLAAHRLDGPAGRSRTWPAGCSRPWPGSRGRTSTRARRGAGPDPPRDALRRRRLALPRRRQHLLRDGRRHPAVRDAARRAAALGGGPRAGRRAAAQRRSGHRVDRAVRRRRRRRLRRVPAGHRPGPRQPGVEGQLGRDPLRQTAGWPRPRSPSARCRPTPTAPTWPAPTSPSRLGDTATYDRFRAKAAQLEGGASTATSGSRTRGGSRWASTPTSGRSTRSPPTSATACGPGSSTRTRPAGWPSRWCHRRCSPGGGCARCPRTDGGYNPISYHCGSVWPHDTAIVAAGLARYGFDGAAQQLIFGLLDAAVTQGGRLPELFSGLDRGELTVPVGYPTSCSPAGLGGGVAAALPADAAAPRPVGPLRQDLALARTCPRRSATCKVEGIPLAGAAGDRRGGRRGARRGAVDGLPPEIELVREPRRPSTAL